MKLLIVSFVLSVHAGLCGAAVRVLDFHSDIRVDASGELTVTELITVQAGPGELGAGLQRNFPAPFNKRNGPDAGADEAPGPPALEVVLVLRNGQPERWTLEALEAGGVSLRLGNPATALPGARHAYRLTYRARGQLRFLEHYDELYWNVNGTWDVPFDRLSAEVSLPERVPANALRLQAFTGHRGAQGRDYLSFARDGAAAFRTLGGLAPGEGMTIRVGFPKGVVAEPTPMERLRGVLDRHRVPMAALVVLLAVGGVPVSFLLNSLLKRHFR